ncbi:MAG: flagellar hook protein FlgE [Allosphingosinicella sp.]|uniref:flagellar hook protein FlgE n=1 Tax=Allosphingosinicella sp. TaxID=2823234 RepID=UPI0039309898
MSFYTSLSGLRGAQTDLSTISNNVANVSSHGFKKSRATFGDIMPASSSMAGQGTRLKGIEQQFSQGGFESSSRELDLAISGSGFFVTRDSLTGGGTYFTRNGSLAVDAQRYLVDSNGSYVQVLPVDADGNVTSTGLASARNLQIPIASGTPRPTGAMNLSVSLPSSADVPAKRGVYSDVRPYAFDRLDPNSYNYTQQTTVYDSAGNPQQATLYFIRTQSTATGDPANSWEVRMFVGNEEASATPGSATPTPIRLEFDGAGALTSPAGPVQMGAVQPSGAVSPIAIAMDFGAATKQAAGTFSVGALEQDGFTAGKLTDMSIGEDGLITASFSDGSTQALGKLLIANFSNPSGLKQHGDARWTATGQSGEPRVGSAGDEGFGRIHTGHLERANVDITEELVSLISAQRNFQANAKAIEAANAMTQSVLNLRN